MQPGERIKLFRKKKGLTQDGLAKKMGYSHGYVADIERGRQKPSRDFLEKLNEVFGISSDYILYGSPDDGEVQKKAMLIREPSVEYQILPTSTKKLLDNVIEILESGNDIMIEAFKHSITAFLEAIRATKKK